MIQIHFIINPIAGSGNHNISKKMLQAFFDHNEYEITVKFSVYKNHTTKLTLESIEQKAQIIVACGGDGTINEVASCILGSPIILGIIPLGSGNGLASNLKIPKKIHKAIAIIKRQDVKKIDAGSLNDRFFFSNTGVGFDAHVIKHYEESNNRKLFSYVTAVFKSLKNINDTRELEVNINDQTFKVKPFMVFISNSNELGYKISLTPKASLEDGLLDIIIVSKLNPFKIILFSFLMLFKRHHLIQEVKSFQTKNMTLSRKDFNHFKMQIDGEYRLIESNTINISISEKAINVFA
ncbi:YegS/Rv2252/BmrU family lipid kinase [Gaetbulibacter aquiaggeris]|uniref:YegS/Rv2252/BmrU family lipid kinase n=1 Tax=Gaetbulibacter aquiaggeris TaxID=1735373 RepID=A0ABW7MN75_9FLAO